MKKFHKYNFCNQEKNPQNLRAKPMKNRLWVNTFLIC